MARSTWDVEVKDSSDIWTNDGNLARPNEDLEIPQVSTQQSVKAADGSELFMIPETKSLYQTLAMSWIFDDGTTKNKIEGYIQVGEEVRITDHNAVQYKGRFLDLTYTWLAGQDPDMYDVRASFQIMPSL